jgi:hypothetical protein
MLTFLEQVNPSLTDFLFLALLQLLMHILTVLEVARGDTKSGSTADIDRTSAATWSFSGMLLTLLAGIVAKGLAAPAISASALVIPLYFIARWAFFHWRTSKLLDSAVIETELREVYRRAILDVFEEPNAGALSAEQIVVRALPYMKQAKLLYDKAALFKRLVPVSIGTLFDRLLPTPDNLRSTLTELVDNKALSFDGERYSKPHRVKPGAA